MKRLAMAAACWLAHASPAAATPSLCRALADAVAAVASDGAPALIASYRPGPGETELPPALQTSAFTYDNALAAIALLACGEQRRGLQIAEALAIALRHDRTFVDGRIRNAYRAGRIEAGPIPLPGWWDAEAKRWFEDRYQVASATGNVAWAGLALAAAYARTGTTRYLDGARRAADWIAAKAARPGASGFGGGLEGFDPHQISVGWTSTEHNIDVYALARALTPAGDPDGRYAKMAQSAARFVESAFDRDSGCFRIGTAEDGRLHDLSMGALDTQLWPLLAFPGHPADWMRALACAQQKFAVDNGFDFNGDRDGMWVEGTAQAALTFALTGQTSEAETALTAALSQNSESGWLFASREPWLSTGLRIDSTSMDNDFFYFRRPHLGATAWAVLAAFRTNPFAPQTMR